MLIKNYKNQIAKKNCNSESIAKTKLAAKRQYRTSVNHRDKDELSKVK